MINEERLVVGISQVLKRIADKGWVASTAINHGRLHIEYTDHGKERMRTLKSIFIDELNVSLSGDHFEALIALLLAFEKTPEGGSEVR